ncbi:MAG: hypothetical protein WA902_08975 [Thermosynechococcaceae cyanobacterium]
MVLLLGAKHGKALVVNATRRLEQSFESVGGGRRQGAGGEWRQGGGKIWRVRSL